MPRKKGQAPLTPTHILDAAIELIDQNGMEHLSMRRLAESLEVKPMALYYYFKDKGALIHAIIDTVLSRCDLSRKKGWEESLRSLSRSLRGVAQQHPSIFIAAMMYEQRVSADFAIVEAFLAALAEGGIRPERAVRGYHTLITFVTGFAVDEISGLLFTFEGAESVLDTLPDEDFPQVKRHRRYLSSVDPDVEFEYGLTALIQGISLGRDEEVSNAPSWTGSSANHTG